ncbi:hypothetical protein [Nocardioides flavescens]|uniref:Uncharacterized protein n=1 Tax=Nocardioides flavescens TaxID=2691959 RepID=A0A6L7F0Q9_9ACTN|nr:hypothetical protein [Nocardioides flavescens]MXG90151.1 hypothetical protein [Nocardioides flavescens]
MADPLPPQHDLLGRWLAHRDTTADDAGVPAPEPAPAPPTPVTAPVTTAGGRHRGEPAPETSPAPEGASLREAVTAAVLRSLEPTAAAHVEEPHPDPAARAEADVDPEPDAPQPSAPAPTGVRADHVFAPRRGTRRLLSAVTAAAAAVTVWALVEALAGSRTDSTSVGLVVIAAVATLTLWAVRASASPARLRVQLGQLEVVRGNRRDVVDLAGDYTVVEVHGRPGRRGWRVDFPRREGEPLVVDASLVDPEEFMRVLRAYRPGVGAGVGAEDAEVSIQ